MTLTELRDKYIKKCLYVQNPRPQRKKAPEDVVLFYNDAVGQIEKLIDQAPLPTGQIWNLERQYSPVTWKGRGTDAKIPEQSN